MNQFNETPNSCNYLVISLFVREEDISVFWINLQETFVENQLVVILFGLGNHFMQFIEKLFRPEYILEPIQYNKPKALFNFTT
jgi:hypothetical protein